MCESVQQKLGHTNLVPHYLVSSIEVSTHMFFGLCMHKWGIFMLVESIEPSHLGAIFMLRLCFEAFLNHPPTYVRTFSLHKVRENWHLLDHPPTRMSLRNIKMAPNSR